MTSWEIIIVLAGIPLAVMVLLGIMTLMPSSIRTRRDRRRSTQQWNHPPVWWAADPESLHRNRSAQHDRSGAHPGYGGCRGNW